MYRNWSYSLSHLYLCCCTGPQERSGHRIVVDDDYNIYCYGGYNPVDPRGLRRPGRNMDDFPMFKELWKYNLASKTWTKLYTTGDKPQESASYACMYCQFIILNNLM